MSESPITIKVFRWAGKFGPFKVSIPCGECSLTKDIIEDCLSHELCHVPVKVIYKDWLSEWYKPLLKGGWHAPIILVENKIISQGAALNRGVLAQEVISAHSKTTPLMGNHLFGKLNCAFCTKAKDLLEKNAISFNYHDVVQSPTALYEMLARVKPLIGAKTPVTVPQIWLDGHCVGGYESLEKFLTERN
jgi:glutaredoxin